MPEIGLIGPSYTLTSASLDAQRTINLYPVLDESKRGKTVGALRGTPGLRLLCTLPSVGAVRGNGLFTSSTGRTFAVQGTGLYEIFASGAYNLLGVLASADGPVCMDDNGLVLALVDGVHGYFLDLTTNAFSQILDANFYGADRVQFLDNYLIFNRPGTQQFYWTALSGTTFDALDFASEEGGPDPLVSLIVMHRELWLLGSQTTVPWFNVGALDNPFQRMQGSFMHQGTQAAQSVARVGETFCWLSANEQGEALVMQAVGGNATRISTHAVEEALQNAVAAGHRLNDALGWGEQTLGHLFYWLTFPTANMTWVYDGTTSLWHERAWLNPVTSAFDRHRAASHTYAFGKHLVGDWQNSNVYQLDPTYYTDNTAPRRWVRRAPYVAADGLPWVFHHSLQLDLEAGVGLDGTGQGTDPQVMLRWSDDGGVSWTEERPATMGKRGERRQRCRWPRLGRSRARVYEVSGTDPVPSTLLAAYLDTEVAA